MEYHAKIRAQPNHLQAVMDFIFPAIILAFGVTAIPEDDKKKHFVAGAAAAEVGRQMGFTPIQSCGLSLAAGIAKEAYDEVAGGTVEGKDVLATVAGCSFTFRF